MAIQIELKRIGNFSPLRYPGGKASLAGVLGQVLKLGQLHNSSYVEPYAGGAGAALTLLYLERIERIVINDLDPAVYAFWKAATQEANWFCDQVLNVPLNIEEWKAQRAVYLDPSYRGTRELGFSFFYLNRTNRSGIVEGWPIGGIRQDGPWKLDARFNRAALAERVRTIGIYRSRIEVKNCDGITLASEFLTNGSGFVYLDPPYFAKGKSLYLNHYLSRDHALLAELLNSKADGNWLLTYDDVEDIKVLYPERRQISFALSYSAHSSKVGSELMITSDSLSKFFA